MTSAEVFWLFVALFFLGTQMAGWWGMFTKAGEPGWAALVPGYNLFVLTRISGLAWGWAIVLLLPPANLIMWAVLCDQLALKFGKGIGHSLGLTWLGFVFHPLLGFGPAAYEGRT
jgi:hypothetical protein